MAEQRAAARRQGPRLRQAAGPRQAEQLREAVQQRAAVQRRAAVPPRVRVAQVAARLPQGAAWLPQTWRLRRGPAAALAAFRPVTPRRAGPLHAARLVARKLVPSRLLGAA